MRLPGSRIWRAFPELDRFSDEQCVRFVHSALGRRSWQRALRSMLVVVLALLVLMASTYVSVTFIGGRLSQGGTAGDWRAIGLPTLATVVLSLIGLLGLMAARDWHLKRSIRRVISTRGTCAGCGYSLLGLRVAEGLLVTCPECGYTTAVDESLGELAGDELGHAVFMPGTKLDVKPIITRRRLAVAGACLLVPALIGGLYYAWQTWWWNNQARLAAAARIEPLRFLEALEPYVNRGGVRAWDVLSRLDGGELLVVTQRLRGASLHLIGFTDVPDDPREDEWASEALRAYLAAKDAGVAGMLAEFQAASDTSCRIDQVQGPGDVWVMASYRRIEGLARWNLARMEMARRAGDQTTFMQAIEQNFALSRLLDRAPHASCWLFGRSIEQGTMDEIGQSVLLGLDAGWLTAVQAAIEKQESQQVPLSVRSKVLRMALLNEVAYWYEDLSRAEQLAKSVGDKDNGWAKMGGFTADAEVVESEMKYWVERGDRPRWEVGPPPRGAQVESPVLQVAGTSRILAVQDTGQVNRHMALLCVALERYRVDQGEYPSGIGQLSPKYLVALPLDPFSGKSYGYRRVDPSADPQNRGYVLYSVGADGVDSGAMITDRMNLGALSNPEPGGDCVLNVKRDVRATLPKLRADGDEAPGEPGH